MGIQTNIQIILDILASSEEEARKTVTEYYKKMGIKNIQFDSVTPTNLGEANGYKVQISYPKEVISYIKMTRNSVISLENRLAELEKRKAVLSKTIEDIQNRCDHKFIVQLKPYDPSSIDNPSRCLVCNQRFTDQFIHYDRKNKGITVHTIHFENLLYIPQEKMFQQLRIEHPELSDDEIVQIIKEKEEKNEERKVQLALQMLEKLKLKFPKLNDEQIIEIINKQVEDKKDIVEENYNYKSK